MAEPVFAGFEPALCATGVGLAVWPGVRMAEMRGPEPVLDELARQTGDATEWFRLSPHRALTSRVPGGGWPDVWMGGRDTTAFLVVCAGPQAPELAAQLMAWAQVMSVEREPGGVRLLVEAGSASGTPDALVRVGREHGAVSVSRQAAQCYLAAR